MRKRRLKSREIFESAVRNFHTEKYRTAAGRFKKVVDFDTSDECARLFYEEAKLRVEGLADGPGVFSFNMK